MTSKARSPEAVGSRCVFCCIWLAVFTTPALSARSGEHWSPRVGRRREGPEGRGIVWRSLGPRWEFSVGVDGQRGQSPPVFLGLSRVLQAEGLLAKRPLVALWCSDTPLETKATQLGGLQELAASRHQRLNSVPT